MAIFFIFGLYFMILNPDKIDVLRFYAVSADFRLNLLFYNLILKFLLYIRSPQYGTTSEVETRTFGTEIVENF